MLLSDIPAIAAQRQPRGIAIRFEGRDRTFQDLRDRCWRLGNALTPLTERGDRVAILAENCPEYVEAYFGVPGAGLALVLLNYRLSPRELAYIIGDSAPRILIVEPKYLPAIQQIRGEIPSIEHVVVIGEAQGGAQAYEALIASGAAAEPVRRPAETEMCWLLYTSGTTGRPKGAMLSHRNLMASILNSMTSWFTPPEDVRLFAFPMFHVAGYAIASFLLRGQEMILMRAFDVGEVLSSIERYRVTGAGMAPTMIAMLLEQPDGAGHDLSSLRHIGYGAAAMPLEVLRAARARWPGVDFYTAFGMTELSGNVATLGPADHDRAAAEGLALLGSVGRPMPLASLRVIDDADRDCPPGVAGEIVVKGDQALMGYWNRPDATAESFVDGWFRTGDVGRWDEEGYLYVVDRKKDMILTGGENVYSREVEEVLYQHPAVAEAAVIAAPDPKWGEKVVAVVSARAPVDEAELIAFCRERLAAYKKPRHVVFVDALPKNASGKVLKRELRDRLAAGELLVAEIQ
jgi:acyl-CoA synthetase (AMP-forming)/AMP-acid ligase II